MFAVKTAAAVAVVILVAIGAGATVCRAQAEPKPLTYLIDDVSRLPSEAARMYAYVTRPFWPRELAYREIPWLVDLNDGMRVAREENRPLLLWTSGDARRVGGVGSQVERVVSGPELDVYRALKPEVPARSWRAKTLSPPAAGYS